MDESSKVIIYTDGASRGNPGESSAGVMMWDANGDPVGRLSLYLGHLTNNQAEYKAVLAALLASYVQGHQHVEFRLDSELVVRQLSGQYKIKDTKLKALASQVQNAAARLESVTFNHIKRSGNDQADSLANEILDLRADDDLPI
ncbi:MAG TPA: ribonuclease HI family protein [Chloroflexota bacterium]|nr:ribonuclease HI family protein [Chloroflexota bacterium]